MAGKDYKFDDFDIICHWQTNDPKREQHVFAFWENLGVLPPEEDPHERIKQIAFCAYDQAGNMVGLTSAYPAEVPHLRTSLLFLRCLIHPKHQRQGLGGQMMKHTRDYFNELGAEGEYMGCKGLGIVMINDSLQKNRNEAVTRNGKFVYIGRTENGFHMGVRYFPDARI